MQHTQCAFCGQEGELLYSQEQQCYVHAQCIVTHLASRNPMALKIAKEFDMISDASECTVGCEECKNRWCGR